MKTGKVIPEGMQTRLKVWFLFALLHFASFAQGVHNFSLVCGHVFVCGAASGKEERVTDEIQV